MTTIDAATLFESSDRRDYQHAGKDPAAFPMRSRVALAVVFALLLVGGVGSWAATAKLSGAVIGQGTVRIDEDLKVIQHMDGGLVREIAVRVGEHVSAGQLLLRLDATQAQTENAILAGQIVELQARRLRLVAEQEGLAALDVQETFRTSHPLAIVSVEAEAQLFESNLDYYAGQIEQLNLQIGQLSEEIAGLDAQFAAYSSELEFASDERSRMRELAASQLVEATRLSTAERDAVRLEGLVGETRAGIARAKSRISELESQIMGLESDRRRVAQRELRTVDAQLAELGERQTAAGARLERIDIVAPVAGIVNELDVSTLGAVISPAERLLTIVPDNADLTIEFRVNVTDIDQIKVGKETTLRFSAFNQRVTPEASGIVTRVAAAAQFDTTTGQSYYTADVEVTEQAVDSAQLVPGMPVEVFVKTEEQSAIAYFMKPVTDQMTRAFRED